MHRTDFIPVIRPIDVVFHLPHVTTSTTVILDMDNTVVRYGTSGFDADQTRKRLSEMLLDSPQINRIIVASNAPHRGLAHVVARARKPYTSRQKLGLGADDQCVVIGDQILTDGLLAWRLQVPFFYSPITETNEPLWPSLQRKLGSFIKPMFFREH